MCASQHGRLQFFSLVERARARGHDPCRLLAWLVQHERFDFITQSDEDAARDRLRKLDYGELSLEERRRQREQERMAQCSRPVEAAGPSQDVQRYIAVCKVVERSRTPLSPATVARRELGWSLQRWDQAEADYWTWQQEKARAVGGQQDFGAIS